MHSQSRVATMVDWWIATPPWLTLEQACFLSGRDSNEILGIISEGGVDLDTDGRIEKRSLWEWLEVSAELAHWQD
jgi:hypothetical protein